MIVNKITLLRDEIKQCDAAADKKKPADREAKRVFPANDNLVIVRNRGPLHLDVRQNLLCRARRQLVGAEIILIQRCAVSVQITVFDALKIGLDRAVPAVLFSLLLAYSGEL